MFLIEIAAYILISLYIICLIYITIFCLMQFHLLYHFLKNPHNQPIPLAYNPKKELPTITIQLPLFNESNVVERLIDAICLLAYPKEKLEIQVLDDSNDDTLSITEKKVKEYQLKGFNIILLHRKDRSGYKAGALKEGLLNAKGEFIAIFDADFIPKSDFLLKTLPYFAEKSVGVVQTKWGHINENQSLLTKVQAMQLNVHFTIEQQGRNNANYLLQFNGTAGIWRNKTIHDAGGWEADTLTEDLDLSYRAQLKKWKIVYLPDIISPAELPIEIHALKSQQHRWMKGGAETAIKLLKTLWKSNINLLQKINGTTHLLSSSVFLFVFMMGVLSVPLMILTDAISLPFHKFGFFMISMLSLSIVYFIANMNKDNTIKQNIRMFFKFILLFPIFLALSMGLSLHNSIAVLQGLSGRKSPFVRTPKYGQTSNLNEIKKSYFQQNLTKTSIAELVMALYFFFALVTGLLKNNTSFLTLHLFFFVGFFTISFYTFKTNKAL